MRLAGKVAVVTGGGSGIGRGIVLAMAREGADIAIADIQVLHAEKVATEVKALGRKVVAMKTDVTSSADVKAMVDRTREACGRIDILVNNAGAGSTPGMPFTNNTEEDWDRTFAVNTKSVFLACKSIAPYFIERKGGRIINIASIAGPLAAVTMPPYSVAKQGVITFTRVVAKELAPHRVTVNAICPGVLWTDFWQKLAAHIAETNPAFKGMTPRQVFEKRVADIVPMKCEQEPEDIGAAAVFLASDEARYITGQALMVDGGCVMWGPCRGGLELRLQRARGGVPQGRPALARDPPARRPPRARLRLFARRPRGGSAAPRLAEGDARGGLRRHGLAARVRRGPPRGARGGHSLPREGPRRGAAGPGMRRHLDARPDAHEARDAGPAEALSAADPDRGGGLVPGLFRAQRGLGSREPPDPRGARGRPVRRQRPEGLDEHCARRRLVLPPRADRSHGAQAPGHQLPSCGHDHAGHRRPAAPTDHGRG